MSTRRSLLSRAVLVVTALATSACSFTGSIREADAPTGSAPVATPSSGTALPGSSAAGSPGAGTPGAATPAAATPAAGASPGTAAPAGTPSATPPSAPSTRPAGLPAATTAGGLDRCHTGELAAALSAPGAGAGQRYATLTLTDTGGTPCTVHGYGGLGLVDGSGAPLPTAQVRVPDPAPRTLVVRPGGAVTATLHWSVVPGPGDSSSGSCQPTPSALQVIPPDETTPLRVAWPGGPVCEAGTLLQDAYTAP
jgi:uncharacterized protein DUF4232